MEKHDFYTTQFNSTVGIQTPDLCITRVFNDSATALSFGLNHRILLSITFIRI